MGQNQRTSNLGYLKNKRDYRAYQRQWILKVGYYVEEYKLLEEVMRNLVSAVGISSTKRHDSNMAEINNGCMFLRWCWRKHVTKWCRKLAGVTTRNLATWSLFLWAQYKQQSTLQPWGIHKSMQVAQTFVHHDYWLFFASFQLTWFPKCWKHAPKVVQKYCLISFIHLTADYGTSGETFFARMQSQQ